MSIKSTSALPAPLPRCPLVPDQISKDHNCYFEIDTRFRKAARLLQVLWLKDRNVEPGIHVRGEGDDAIVMPLHSNLSSGSAARGLNFLSPDVHTFVRRELIMREEGAAIDEQRLYGNALSSMPMTFNMFGPLAMDLDLASRVFKALLPGFISKVEGFQFEHSPGRRLSRFLDDGTAFDLAVHVTTPEGESATVFIETKYSEDMAGPAARLRDRYDEVSRGCGLFVDPDSPMLRSLALEQLWREHMLAQLCVDQQLASRAIFVAVGPRLNRRVMAAFRCFQNELIPNNEADDNRVAFCPMTLEEVFSAIEVNGAPELARDLYARYADFDRIFHLCMNDTDTLAIETSTAKTLPPEKKETTSRISRTSRARRSG
jgi:hypothetical protein